LRSKQIPNPLRVSIEGDSDRIPLIRAHVQNLVARAPRLLRYAEIDPDISAAINKDELRVFFRGQPGVVFHSMRSVQDEGAAQRIAIGSAISLSNFGALNEATELWCSLPGLAQGVGSVDVAWPIVSLLARAGAHDELLAVIRELRPRLGRSVIAPMFPLYFSAPTHRREAIRNVLVQLEKDDLQEDSPEAKSIALYNLAKLSTKPREQLRFLARAIRESGFYVDRSYFWAELGALLFSEKRYLAALCAYRHAYIKLKHGEHKTYYADALMHTGRYEEALKAVRKIVREHPESVALTPDVADALIKERALASIVENLGITKQKRQRRLAITAVGQHEGGVTDGQMLARTLAAIQEDAMYSVAWLNRAVAQAKLGKEPDALLSYVTAGAVRNVDDPSWLKAMFLAARHDQTLLAALLVYVAATRGENFVSFMAKTAQQQPSDKAREALAYMAQIFSENLPKEDDPIVRMHSDMNKPPIIFSASSVGLRKQKEKAKRQRKLKDQQKRRNRAKSRRKK
jgi:tetratricopeptide (TPR) repeat protein